MHNGPRRENERAKNFTEAIKRLFKELKGFKVLIIVSLILAMFGSILSIFAPNKLSDLTDEIQKGLIVKTENIEIISQNIQSSLNEEKVTNIINNVIKIDLTNETIAKIMYSDKISDEEKEAFNRYLNGDKKTILKRTLDLPASIQSIILPTTKYNGKSINTIDKINLIDFISKLQSQKFLDIDLNENNEEIVFESFRIGKTTISASDQAKFIKLMSNMDNKSSYEEMYKKIDEAPLSIQTVIRPTMNMKNIKRIAMFLASLYILSALFTYFEQLIMAVVSNNFAKDLRNKITNKINRLPLKYFDKNQTGDILSRVTNDIDTVAQSMNQSLASLVSALTLFIGTIIMMFYTNYILAFTAIGSSLIGFVFMFIILGKSQKYFEDRQRELGKLNSHIEEVYSGLNVVKVYNGKKQSDEKFDKYNKSVYEANRKSQFLSGLMPPMMGFIGNFGYVAVCIVGALLTMDNKISFGVIVAFITYVRMFTSPLSQIAQGLNTMQSTAAASERVFEFLDEEEMPNEDELTKKLDVKDAKGNIEFRNVSFKYDGNEKYTIKNFNAKVKAGQKIAIVGPTGAGKTTMVNLLMKFYDIDKGDIIIDGISIKELKRDNIHKLFTMVLQDTWLFDGTVKENIKYNDKDISDKDIKEICKVVGIDHFIKTLSNSYDSKLTESESVSSGEKQLLTIARGMAKYTPFLILDEATSNVDTRTEELVQSAMDKLMEDRTSFIIAHRLSTIKNADLILVMNDGNIIEQGTHDELMKKKGFYADLYNSQFVL